MKAEKLLLLTWTGLAGLALALGAALLLASLLPFAALKPLLDSLAADGSLESFTPSAIQALAWPARVCGAALLGLGAAAIAARGRVLQGLPGAWAGLRRLGPGLWAEAGELWAAVRRLERDRLSWLALGLLTLGGTALRLAYLWQPMRYDEAYSFLVFAVQPFDFIISDYHVPNNHVLHSLWMAIAYRLFGIEPWVVRLPALLGGILLIPAAWLVARSLYDRWTALLSAGLVAVSSYLVEYATDGRGYTLLALFGLLVVGLAAYLRRRSSRLAWMLLVLCAALGFYTVPVMLYPFGAALAWLGLSWLLKDTPPQSRRAFPLYLLAAGMAAGLLAALLYLPILRAYGLQALVGNRFVSPLPWDEFTAALPGSLNAAWNTWTRDMPVWLGGLLGIAFLAGPAVHGRGAGHRAPLGLAFALWIVPLVLLQRVAPWARVWLFLLPLFYVSAAAGISRGLRLLGLDRLPWGQAAVTTGGLLACLLLGISVLRSPAILESGETGTLRDAEAITLDLQKALVAGDVVLSAVPSNYPLRYYFLLHGLPSEALYLPRYGVNFRRAFVVVNDFHPQTLEEVLRKQRLQGILDPAAAALYRAYPAARVYLISR
jgi:hypothetical protein